MYDTPISRTNPACILFLLDRSASMSEPFGVDASLSLAQGACNALNRILFDLCLRSQKDVGAAPRPYFDVGVIGYGRSGTADRELVEPALAGKLTGRPIVSISELATNPLAIREVQRHADAPPTRMPVWFDPVAGHRTPMCQAIAVAGQHLADWVKTHPDSYPPVVINITDGVVTDSPYSGASLVDWSRRLTTLATHGGNTLLFNVFLSSHQAPVSYFPSDSVHLPEPGPELFDISSALPEPMAKQASACGLPVTDRARGLVFNADLAALAKFLDIGTRLRVVDR